MLTPRGCSLLHNFSSFKYSFTIPKHFMCKVLILSTPATFVDIILTATAQKKSSLALKKVSGPKYCKQLLLNKLKVVFCHIVNVTAKGAPNSAELHVLDKLLLINKPNVNATVCLEIDGENVYMSGGVYQVTE